MAVKETRKYLILFVIGLGFDELVRAYKLTSEYEIVIGSINDPDVLHACNCMPISKEAVITDLVCIENALEATFYGPIYIHKINSEFSFTKDYEVNASNIIYVKETSKKSNKLLRFIAILPIKPQINLKYLRVANDNEVNWSRCVIIQPNKPNINLSLCVPVKCRYDKKKKFCSNLSCKIEIPTVILGNIVGCSLKEEPEVMVIAGIISGGRGNTLLTSNNYGDAFLTVENVSDLGNIIYEQLPSL